MRASKSRAAIRERSVALDGKNLRGQFREQRSQIARSSTDFQNFIGWRKRKNFEHARYDVRLRDGLAFADGQRMIFVGLIAVAFGREVVTRHLLHGREDALVGDAACPQLGLDHAAA